MALHRRDILNMCCVAIGATSYLEIGVRRPSDTFNHIWATDKTGVDPHVHSHSAVRPQTSDEFFEGEGRDRTWDLIFVDGDHSLPVVARDVANALERVSSRGIVAMHDVNPATAWQATPSRHPGPWCGEAWRVFLDCRTRPDLEAITVLDRGGAGVGLIVKRCNSAPLNLDPQIRQQLTFADLSQHRRSWLRLFADDLAIPAIRIIAGIEDHPPEHVFRRRR